MGSAGTDAEDRMLGLPSTSVLTPFSKKGQTFQKKPRDATGLKEPLSLSRTPTCSQHPVA